MSESMVVNPENNNSNNNNNNPDNKDDDAEDEKLPGDTIGSLLLLIFSFLRSYPHPSIS
jgi:hypothetical protein